LANYNWAQVAKKAAGLGRPPVRRLLREWIRIMTGFSASDLAEKVRAMSGESDSAYGARRAVYEPEPDSKLSHPTPAISTTKTSAPARRHARPLHCAAGDRLRSTIYSHPFG
jgi:hypothetical protein